MSSENSEVYELMRQNFGMADITPLANSDENAAGR